MTKDERELLTSLLCQVGLSGFIITEQDRQGLREWLGSVERLQRPEDELVTLAEFVGEFESLASAARCLGWQPQHLQARLGAKKTIWVCKATKTWYSEGGKYE